MTFKDKLILIILSILTLGIYPLVIFNKKDKAVKNELSVDKKVTVNVSSLLTNLGGKDNIAGCEFTHTKVKIFIKDRSKVEVENIQNIKNITGVFATSKHITIIVGKQAKELAAML